jgi:tape measure domain-containing protein
MAIEIEVKSNSRQARGDLDRLNKSVDNISDSANRLTSQFDKLVKVSVAAFATIGSVRAITNVTDSYRRLESRIALTTTSLIEQEKAFRALNNIAIRTRSNQEGLADLYSRISRATTELGYSQETVIQVTENIAKSITISGASAESANAAIVQLGQGLAAGALRGQELNSVMEQTPAVAQALARGLNLNIGELRAFANEGKLSAEIVIEALKSQGDVIDEEFKRIKPTFGQANVVFGTGLGRIVNEIDQAVGFTGGIVNLLLSLGNTLNNIAPKIGESVSKVLTGLKSIGDNQLIIKVGNLLKAIKGLATSIFDLAVAAGDRLIPKSLLVNLQEFKNVLKVIASTISPLIENVLVNITKTLIMFTNRLKIVTASVERSFLGKNERAFAVGLSSFLGDLNADFEEFTSNLVLANAILVNTFVLGFQSASTAIDVFNNKFKVIAAELMFVPDAQFFRVFGDSAVAAAGVITSTLSLIAKAIGKFSDGLEKGYERLLDNPLGNFSLAEVMTTVKSLFETLLDGVGLGSSKLNSMFSAIGKYAQQGLSKALKVVKDFAKSVMTAFREVYIDVVGNSTWPDLIKGVINWAKTGLQTALNFVKGFALAVINVFAGLVLLLPEKLQVVIVGIATVLANLGLIVTSTVFNLVSTAVSGLVDLLVLQIGLMYALVRDVVSAFRDVDSVAAFVYAVRDAFVALGKTLRFSITGSIGIVTSTLVSMVSILIVSLTTSANYIYALFLRIGIYVSEKLKYSLQTVKAFAKGVVNFFKWAYIEIVGNSWWPDTIDQVNAKTLELARSLSFVGDFAKSVVNYFRRIYKEISSIDFDFDLDFSIGSIDTSAIKTQVAIALAAIVPLFYYYMTGGLLKLIAKAAVSFGILSYDSIVETISTISFIIAEAVGMLIVSFISRIPELVHAMFRAASAAGAGLISGLLESIPLVGTALNAIVQDLNSLLLGLPSAVVGGILLRILLGGVSAKSFSSGIITGLKDIFQTIKIASGGVLGEDTKRGLLTSLLFGKDGSRADLAARLRVLFVNAQTLSLNFLEKVLLAGEALKLFTLQVIANLKVQLLFYLELVRTNIVLAFYSARLYIATAAHAALTTALAFATTAARAFWTALLGPIGIILLVVGALVASFAATADEIENTSNKLNDLRDDAQLTGTSIKELFNVGPNLYINVVPVAVDPEKAFEKIAEANRKTLETIYDDSLVSFLVLDEAFLDLATGVANYFRSAYNTVSRLLNIAFDVDIGKLTEDTESAVDKLLKAKAPKLFIELDIDKKEVAKFANADLLGKLFAEQQKLVARRQELDDAEGFFSLANQADIAELNRQIVESQQNVATLTGLLKQQINISRNLDKLTQEYESINSQLETSTTFFGEQIVAGLSTLDIAKLTSAERKAYNGLITKALKFEANINALLSSGKDLTEEQKDELAAQLRLLENINVQVDQLNTKLVNQTNLDIARNFGIDDNTFSNLDTKQLEEVVLLQNQIESMSKIISNLQEQDVGGALLQQYQEELVDLNNQRDALTASIDRSQLTSFDKLSADLDLLGQTVSQLDFDKLPKDIQGNLQDYADTSKALSDQLAKAKLKGNLEQVATLQSAIAALGGNLGEYLTKVVAKAVETPEPEKPEKVKGNFEIALEPFQELGLNFDTDTFLDLGKTFSDGILKQAKELSEKRKTLDKQAFDSEALRLQAVADFNRKIYEFEEDVRKKREDALKSEKDAAKLGQGISGAIMGAIRGDKSFGEGIADLFANSVETALANRITSFAEGFITGIFDALDAASASGDSSLATKTGGFLRDLMTGPNNAESDSISKMGYDSVETLGNGGIPGLPEASEGVITFTEGLQGGISGLGQWASTTLQSIAQFFGLATATTAQTTASATATASAGVLTGAFTALTTAAFAASAALSMAAASSGTAGALSIAGSFADGGITPRGGAMMLHPNEMILNPRQQKHLFEQVNNNRSGSINQVTQNINITGDISRQTKKEIYSMMPSIAQGVNQQNKETNR